MSTFDLAIIGAGPGGFEAALRARELGFKAALIEKSEPGGTCLNTGCIPTKTLLASTKFLTKIKNAESLGLPPVTARQDLTALFQRKNRVVESLRKGMLDSLHRSGVEWISGQASFAAKNRLLVESEGKSREVEFQSAIIATGSLAMPFPGVPFDGESILSSTDLLNLPRPFERLLIIGGGVVGVEFASIFQPLGVSVVIVEMLPRLIPGEDEEVARRLESIFSRKGIEVHTGEKVKSLKTQGGRVEAALESGKKLDAGKVLVATGRRAHTEGLGLERIGIKTEKGSIGVNEYFETSVSGIFAIGDVTNRSTGLAHGASAEAVAVVEGLKGQKRRIDRDAIPSCIYSDPEVASVGAYRSAPEKPKAGIVECKVLFAGIGKSQVEGETEGFIKMMASKKDGRILGVTGIGAHLSELIHEGVLAVKAGLDVKTVAETVHAHPTQSEIFQKAAQRIANELS